MRSYPNQGIRATLRFITLISLFSCMSTVIGSMIYTVFVGVSLFHGLIAGLGSGIGIFGYGIWTALGGIGIYRHWMLRLTLSDKNYLPYNLARFLDYATSIILLRKVGGGYIFIHRYLLEYFAELKTDEPTDVSTD